MAEKYIVSHDLGTSGNKAVLVTIYGEIVDKKWYARMNG